MSLVRKQAAFLVQTRDLMQKAMDLGFVVAGGELHRTAEQQALYVKNGRSKTMNSQHLKRLAIDLNFFLEQPDGSLKLVYDVEKLRSLGDYWESLDPANRWGGNWNNFKDTPHFERREDYAVSHETKGKVIDGRDFSSAGKRIISAAVGSRCPNHREDVETVQRLLNRCFVTSDVQIHDELVPDGLFGQNTLKGICEFQRSALDMKEPDGVISVGGSTISALCKLIPQGIDQDLFALLYLKADKNDVDSLWAELIQTMNKRAIDTPLRQAHFLAQIGHESGELRFHEELASGEAYEGRQDLGNTEPGDGARFKGRGLIQLTGRANYRAYGRSKGREEDLLTTPEIVASDSELCVDVAGWYWERHKLNVQADRDDLEAVTRRINGGLNGLADRRRLLEKAKVLLAV